MESKCFIFYDGICKLCNGWVRFLIRHDPELRFQFIPIQLVTDPGIRLCLMQESSERVVVYNRGEWFAESQAVLEILKCMDFPWKALTILGFIPSSLLNRIYAWIARKRYSVFGRFDSCPVVPPDQKDHFPDPTSLPGLIHD